MLSLPTLYISSIDIMEFLDIGCHKESKVDNWEDETRPKTEVGP